MTIVVGIAAIYDLCGLPSGVFQVSKSVNVVWSSMKKSILMTIGVFLLCWYMSAFAFGLVTWFLWGGFEYYYPAPLLLVTSIIAVVFYRRDECNGLEAVILSIAAGFILKLDCISAYVASLRARVFKSNGAILFRPCVN